MLQTLAFKIRPQRRLNANCTQEVGARARVAHCLGWEPTSLTGLLLADAVTNAVTAKNQAIRQRFEETHDRGQEQKQHIIEAKTDGEKQEELFERTPLPQLPAPMHQA